MSSDLLSCGSTAALAADDLLRELRTFANAVANAGATLRQHTVKKLTGGSRLRGATLGLHAELLASTWTMSQASAMCASLQILREKVIEITRLLRVLVYALLFALQLA
jgi:hypothetical protein